MYKTFLILLLIFTDVTYATTCTEVGNRTVCSDPSGNGKTCIEAYNGTIVCSDN